MSKIKYNHPTVAGHLLTGFIFFIIGLPDDLVFLFLSVCFIVSGLKENKKLL